MFPSFFFETSHILQLLKLKIDSLKYVRNETTSSYFHLNFHWYKEKKNCILKSIFNIKYVTNQINKYLKNMSDTP